MNIEKYFNRVLLKSLLRNVNDPRSNARKWSFHTLVRTTMQAMLSGCSNLRECEYLTSRSGERIPDTTLGDFLAQLSEKEIEHELARGVKQASRSHELDRQQLPIRLTVVDGKCLSTAPYDVDDNWLRRSQKGCTKYVAMALRAYLVSSDLKLHLAQSWVPKGTNERGAFPELLEKLKKLYGRTKLLEVISIDAGITSMKNAQAITDAGLDYIMALKNATWSKMTQQAIAILTHEPVFTEVEHVNGKHITRKLFRASAPKLPQWQHAREVWRVEKITETATSTKTENHYYVTSLPKARLTDKQVLKTVRMHWNIENNANWVLDTAWREDKNPWTNSALGVVSLLRMLAYNAVARFKLRKLKPSSITPIAWKNLLASFQAAFFPLSSTWCTQFS